MFLGSVLIHPIAILGALGEISNFNKPASDRNLNGCFVGFSKKSTISCLSSFQVPFDCLKNDLIWFLDHNYIEKMSFLCKKVNLREKIVGFYSFRDKLKEFDNELINYFRRYSSNTFICLLRIDKDSYCLNLQIFSYQETFSGHKMFRPSPLKIGMLKSEVVGIHFIIYDSILSELRMCPQILDNLVTKLGNYFKKLKSSFMIHNSIEGQFGLYDNFNFGSKNKKFVFSVKNTVESLKGRELSLFILTLLRLFVKSERLSK
mmetsp:Transcript_46650/g.73023  ORF Transcript_46650/g.73023 Transcript_46650/m.73023 type:complete len:261 (-) Transcript_46650:3711-4493(-)